MYRLTRIRALFCASALVLGASAGAAWSQPDDAPPEPVDPDSGSGSGSAAPPPEGSQAPPEPPPEPPAPTTGTITGLVEATDLEAPLAGAKVTVVGTSTTAVTDAEGKFTLELPPGKIKLRVESPGFKTVEKDVVINAGGEIETTFPMLTEELQNEVVVIVGSRTPRTQVETPVAVDVVTAEEISRTGRAETGRVLHTLAPSFISTPQTIADGSDHVDPASLRGLGPDQVLVLVNGKRRHKSALLHVNGTFGRGTVGTDLNAIAVGSIKRIEILRDGAASQYGSDAIAGVINIVTKDATDVVQIDSLTGITGSGDGGQVKTSANYGFKIGEKGFVNFTGEFFQREPTNRSGAYTGAVFTDDRALDDETLAANGLERDDFRMRIGESASTLGVGAFNLELPAGERSKVYAFGDASHRNGRAAGFYRFPRQVKQNVPQFYPLGFLPEIHSTIDDAALTVGVQRKGGWDVDVSLTHGRSAFQFGVENSVNASLGTDSPTTFDAGTVASSQTVGNLDLLKKVDTTAVKSLSFVVGSEFRVENYRIEAGDEASYVLGTETVEGPMGPEPKLPGAQVFPGFQPSNEVDRTRNSIGVYTGVESAITKRFTLDAGGRFEQYSDFGNSLIGKIATRLELYPGYAVRAAGSTGFRAPSLQQLWFSNISTQFIQIGGVLTPSQILTSNNASPITKAFAIPELTEEKSINASAGLTARPVENLSITVDGYFIRLIDRIVLTSTFSTTNPVVAEILQDFPSVSQAQFFANAVDTDTTGLDAVIDYMIDLEDAGALTLTASANFTRTRVRDVNIPQSLVDRFAGDPQLRTFFFGRLAENRLEDAVPHQKGTAAVRYAGHGLSALVRANYYGQVKFKPDDRANDETFGARVLLDVDLGYQLSKNLLLSIGADNLLNTFPEEQTKAANISDGRFIYSRNVSQFGQNGGFYYAKLGLTFF